LAHEPLQLGDDLTLFAVERLDLRAIAVEQLQTQPGRRVIAAAAVATRERRQARADRFGVGQLLA
jgi:hypothetical protein